MRIGSTAVVLTLALICCVPALAVNVTLDRARHMEDDGNAAGARALLAEAVKSSSSDAELLTGYADCLERDHDPQARTAFRNAAAEWKKQNRLQDAMAAVARAVMLDLIAGDRAAAETDLSEYRELGGKDLTLPAQGNTSAASYQSITIPGPYRSFARMAALSQDAGPADILPALARNVITGGYQASHGSDQLEATEYLKLLQRYLSQVKELDQLAGPEHVIKVPQCESTQTNDLLRVLGYRMRGGCGSEVVLETVNAARAFLTTDSGFPLSELEKTLQSDRAFTYAYPSTRADVIYTPDYWMNSKEKAQGNFLEALLGDPALCRFYLGMSRIDPETAEALRSGIPTVRLRGFAAVLDFFGGNFEVRGGKAVVPGGARSAAAWGDLAGASPDKGAEFFDKLMSKDDGWLAGLYDSLARIHGPVQDYLTDPARMKRFYAAVRGKVTTPGPARPVFNSNADMMLLTTRLQLDPGGKAHIPGGLEVWKGLFSKGSKEKYDLKLSTSAPNWKDPDDVIEALFALCRKPVENEPLRMFMALTDMDRVRPQSLAPATVERLAHDWPIYNSQYTFFSDVPSLSDKTMIAWLDAASSLDKQRDQAFRQDAIGTYQGLTGLWQIFCRQGSIPAARADAALLAVVGPFTALKNNRELFDAGRHGLSSLLESAGAGGAGPVHERIMALLAGGSRSADQEIQSDLIKQQERFFDAQALFSPDTIFELSDNLEAVAKGEKLNAQLAARLAAKANDIQMPRSSMTFEEKGSQAFGYWVDRHINDQRKLNLRAQIDKASKDPAKLQEIRGLLAPALRDTIVGYNYIRYAPPGAQILLTNPLFVRGHDFVGAQGGDHAWQATSMYGSGWPSSAGGRLIGSLSALPYALAEAEKDFLVPTQTQALIWGDLVPQMILSATIPRYWDVTPAQLRWVSATMRHAESMLAQAAVDPVVRGKVLDAVESTASLIRYDAVARQIATGNVARAIELLTPSELYVIGQTLSGAMLNDDPGGQALARLRAEVPDQVSPEAISRTWGTSKPTLTSSYRQELLNLRTFPALMGYSSRIMAESWESNQLYWAQIADEMGIRPAEMALLVPNWTQLTVERIFASHLEDWPALLRSLRSVGEDALTGKLNETARN
ncbi:MAG TPA: hypothetical protein VHC90_18890 [Bryobacteraceae bacterium]|nr:hypothetical protein [Bryobacteraceae bacterium]